MVINSFYAYIYLGVSTEHSIIPITGIRLKILFKNDAKRLSIVYFIRVRYCLRPRGRRARPHERRFIITTPIHQLSLTRRYIPRGYAVVGIAAVINQKHSTKLSRFRIDSEHFLYFAR